MTQDTTLQNPLLPDGVRPVVTIGNFDGTHLGHQTIFKQVIDSARRRGTMSLALTFDPHPVVHFGRKEPGTFLINNLQQRLELIKSHGIDIPMALPFRKELFSLSPQAFVEEIVHKRLRACEVWVGYDFNFGKGRSGTTEDLKRHALEHGIEPHIHEAVCVTETVVSSTRVRKTLAAGHMEEAASLMGRPHTLRGEVEHGYKRGRTLGFPTANIVPTAGMMIPRGVYVSLVRVLGQEGAPMAAITNVGVRPTAQQDAVANAETHVLEGLAPGADLYGQSLDVSLLSFVRPEKKFGSLDELKAQIAADVAVAAKAHGL